MSPRLLRSLSIALKAAAHALATEADELEQRAQTLHDYQPIGSLPAEALAAASAGIRRLGERGAIERCTKCGALRTTSAPWRFFGAGASAWASRKPTCKGVAS